MEPDHLIQLINQIDDLNQNITTFSHQLDDWLKTERLKAVEILLAVPEDLGGTLKTALEEFREQVNDRYKL